MPHWHDENNQVICEDTLHVPVAQDVNLLALLIHQDAGENHLENILPQHHTLDGSTCSVPDFIFPKNINIVTPLTLLLPCEKHTGTHLYPPEDDKYLCAELYFSISRRGPPSLV